VARCNDSKLVDGHPRREIARGILSARAYRYMLMWWARALCG
jgi:hypothetical protein